jgi:hypothetical protein
MATAVIGAIGTGISVAGKIKQGKAQKAELERQAAENRRNAEEIRRETREEENNFRVIARKQIGNIRAQMSAQGVTVEGSGAEVLAESARNAARDAAAIRRRGDVRAGALERGAISFEAAGRAARSASILSAVGTGVGGIGTFAKQGGFNAFSSKNPTQGGVRDLTISTPLTVTSGGTLKRTG